MKYRPEIDGLRTIAVVPVILFHLNFDWIGGGYIGVDVFFVISGFLITTIILHEFDNGQFTIKAFWTRRIRRILPALAVVISATLSVLTVFSFRGDTKQYGIQGVAALLSFSNIAFWWNTGNYWGSDAQDSPFLHTWSLSVEEQFYLIYPILIVLVLRIARAWLTVTMVLVTLSSFVLYLIGSYYNPTATFYLLPTRAWELGCGCLLAIWRKNGVDNPSTPNGLFAEGVALLGLVVVITSYFVFSAGHFFTGYLAIPVLGASLVIGYTNFKSGVGRLLSLRMIVFIGKMSYSLYLWHWPVIVLVPRRMFPETGITRAGFLLILTALLAYLSFRLVETPTRRAPLNSRHFVCCLLLVFINLTLCWYLHSRSPYYNTTNFSPVVWEGSTYASAPIDAWESWGDEMTIGINATIPDSAARTAWANGGIIKRHGNVTPEIVVMGDSHALMWAGTIDRIAARLNKTVSFYAAYDTSPFFTIPVKKAKPTVSFDVEQRYIFDNHRLECLKLWNPKVVVLAVRWSAYGTNLPPDDLIEFLGTIGTTVILIQQPPELYFGERNAMQYLSFLGLRPKQGDRHYLNSIPNEAAYRRGQIYVQSLCSKYQYCHAVEVESELRDASSGKVCVLDGSEVLYLDDDHLSQFGAEKFLQTILKAIDASFTPKEK